MRSMILATALLGATASPANAAVVATGVVTSSGQYFNVVAGLVPGATTHVRISVDKPVYSLSGTYDFAYDWKTPACDISQADFNCVWNRDYRYIPTQILGAQYWGVDVSAPALDFNGYSTVYKVFDYGLTFSVSFDENTYMNAPVTWTLEAWTDGVPEPASWAMMISGMGLAGAMLRARRRSSSRPSRSRRDLRSGRQPSA